MANQDVRVSALNSTSTLSTEDLSLETVVDELSETGYTSKKITEGAKASQYLEAFTYANLNTTAKTIVDAINEAAESGGSGGGRLDIEYDSVEEIFNVTSDEIVEALENGFMLTFSSDETADGFLYTLNSVYPDGDEILLFFNRFWTMGNGSGNPLNADFFQCLVTVDTANDTVTFGGYSEVANVLSTIDNVTGQYNNWSASKIDTAIKQAIYNVLPTRSASGTIASFTDGAENMPIVDGVFGIEATQEGSGDPSPSNVRPISGRSAVNVTRTGKNLLDPQLLNGYWDSSTGEFVSNEVWRASKKIKCKPNTTYVMSGTTYTTGGYSGRSLFWDESGNYLGYRGTGANFTSYPNSAYMAMYMGSSYVTAQMQIEEGSTATTYEPYTGETVEISLGQTVYGGTLDVTSGVLTIANRKVKPTTQSNISGSIHTSNNVWAFTLSEEQAIYAAQTPLLSNINNSMGYTVATVSGFCMALVAGKPIFALADSDSGLDANSTTTQILNAFHAFVEAYSPEAVYPLATPVEIQLSPVEINTLLGSNNIWCDTGNSTVKYKADIGLLISELEAVGGNRSLSLTKSAPEEVKEEKSEEKEEKTEEGGNDER